MSWQLIKGQLKSQEFSIVFAQVINKSIKVETDDTKQCYQKCSETDKNLLENLIFLLGNSTKN